MVRALFLIATLAYLGIQSLFVQTSHTIVGERHVFAYNTAAIILGLGFNIVPLGAAAFLWRVKRDRAGAVMFLLCIPLIGFFVMPQFFMERVEVTPTQIIHRREPPHTRFNADVAFADIVSVVELQYESGIRGYLLTMKSGPVVELPANTVLTSANGFIDAEFEKRNIPITTRTVIRRTEQ